MNNFCNSTQRKAAHAVMPEIGSLCSCVVATLSHRTLNINSSHHIDNHVS